MNVAAFCVIALSALGAGERGYLLEFSSETCGPCQQVAPVVAKLEREGLPIRSVDVNADHALAQQYNVTSIPAFVLVVDDKEVERNVGYQSEGQIRQMLARIPQQSRGPGSDRLTVSLGDEAPLPRPDVTEPAEPRVSNIPRGNSVESQDETPRRFWPFPPKKSSNVTTDIRGNSPEATPPADVPAQSAAADPMAASVRIRIITGNSVVKGSGTIIESLAGRSTILTCSHICRGATPDTKVEIDLFRDGQPVTIVGTIVGTDPDADVGLLSIPTDEAVAFCPVGSASQSPGMGAKVVSIGCGGGSEPTREQLRVKDVNKFSGPDTLICSGVPIQGRSGGGLFNEAGTLVGVCFAADSDLKTKKPSGGVYCGLKPIHALLAKHEMSHLIPSEGGESLAGPPDSSESAAPQWPPSSSQGVEAPLAITEPKSEEEPDSKVPDFDPPTKEPAKPFLVTPSKSPPVEEFVADDAEIVVLIRGRSENSPSDKVILIHKPSRKFMQFLQGEVSGDGGEAAPMTSRSGPPTVEAPTDRVVRAKLPTTSLQATGLKVKRELRPYVRSKSK